MHIRPAHLLIINILVATKDLLLELLHILVPQFSSLAVQGGSTVSYQYMISNADIGQYSLVWLSKQALQTQQDGLDVVRSSPLIFQDI